MNGPEAGTFRFSVLDNGVTSNEFWTIAGAADDLSWIVFHYAGAARVVGQVSTLVKFYEVLRLEGP